MLLAVMIYNFTTLSATVTGDNNCVSGVIIGWGDCFSLLICHQNIKETMLLCFLPLPVHFVQTKIPTHWIFPFCSERSHNQDQRNTHIYTFCQYTNLFRSYCNTYCHRYVSRLEPTFQMLTAGTLT